MEEKLLQAIDLVINQLQEEEKQYQEALKRMENVYETEDGKLVKTKEQEEYESDIAKINGELDEIDKDKKVIKTILVIKKEKEREINEKQALLQEKEHQKTKVAEARQSLLKDKQQLEEAIESVAGKKIYEEGKFEKPKEQLEYEEDLNEVNGKLKELKEQEKEVEEIARRIQYRKRQKDILDAKLKPFMDKYKVRDEEKVQDVSEEEKTEEHEKNVAENVTEELQEYKSSEKDFQSSKTEDESKNKEVSNSRQEVTKEQIGKITKDDEDKISDRYKRKMDFYKKLGFVGRIKEKYKTLKLRHQKEGEKLTVFTKMRLAINSVFMTSKTMSTYMLDKAEKEIIDEKAGEYLYNGLEENEEENLDMSAKMEKCKSDVGKYLSILRDTTEKKKIGKQHGKINEINNKVKTLAVELKSMGNNIDTGTSKLLMKQYQDLVYELHILGVPMKDLPPANFMEEQPLIEESKHSRTLKFMHEIADYTVRRGKELYGKEGNPELNEKYQTAYENSASYIKSVDSTQMLEYKRAILEARRVEGEKMGKETYLRFKELQASGLDGEKMGREAYLRLKELQTKMDDSVKPQEQHDTHESEGGR